MYTKLLSARSAMLFASRSAVRSTEVLFMFVHFVVQRAGYVHMESARNSSFRGLTGGNIAEHISW
jgi:hypothetical protein